MSDSVHAAQAEISCLFLVWPSSNMK